MSKKFHFDVSQTADVELWAIAEGWESLRIPDGARYQVLRLRKTINGESHMAIFYVNGKGLGVIPVGPARDLYEQYIGARIEL